MIKIKVVDLQKLYNFVVETILIKLLLPRKNTSNFWNMKISICQETSNGETFKMKVVETEKLWNFVVNNFFIWNHIIDEKLGFNLSNLKFKFCKWHRMKKLPKWKL
jgi:hypothetical protein